MTIRHYPCPRCGHVIDIVGSAEDDPDAVIDSLRAEIRQLRETTAYLRGSLGWPVSARGH
jgi:predicted nucleic acid-binding Zn ribbon protein